MQRLQKKAVIWTIKFGTQQAASLLQVLRTNQEDQTSDVLSAVSPLIKPSVTRIHV